MSRGSGGAPVKAHALALLVASMALLVTGGNGQTPAPDASGGSYVDVSSNANAEVEGRFGTQPSQRSGQSLTLVDSDTAVLFGGLSPTGTQNDVWEYKMADKKWTRLHEGGAGPMDTAAYSTVPSPRTGHVGVVLRGDLYVFGGYDPSRGDTNDVWKFTRAGGTWHRLEPAGGADVPASRSGHAAVAPDPSGSKFTVFGGNMRNDVWEFDVDTGAWTVVMTEYAGSSGAAMRGVGAVLVAVGAAAATTLASGEWWRNF